MLVQSATISDLFFDLVHAQEGLADDIPECAFAASKLACLRSIESVNPGFVSAVKGVYSKSEELHNRDIPLPARQLAALLAVDPTFLHDDRMTAESSCVLGR
jgi:hypothetical protein